MMVRSYGLHRGFPWMHFAKRRVAPKTNVSKERIVLLNRWDLSNRLFCQTSSAFLQNMKHFIISSSAFRCWCDILCPMPPATRPCIGILSCFEIHANLPNRTRLHRDMQKLMELSGSKTVPYLRGLGTLWDVRSPLLGTLWFECGSVTYQTSHENMKQIDAAMRVK